MFLTIIKFRFDFKIFIIVTFSSSFHWLVLFLNQSALDFPWKIVQFGRYSSNTGNIHSSDLYSRHGASIYSVWRWFPLPIMFSLSINFVLLSVFWQAGLYSVFVAQDTNSNFFFHFHMSFRRSKRRDILIICFYQEMLCWIFEQNIFHLQIREIVLRK